MPVLAALHIIVSQQYRMEVARVNAFRGGCGGWVPHSKTAPKDRCVSQYPSKPTQALHNFLTATSDSKPTIMPRNQSGLVGTGVAAAGAGVAVTLPVWPVSGVKIRCGLSQPVAL